MEREVVVHDLCYSLIYLIGEISGKAVILATGGYSNDHDEMTSLLIEFAKDKMHYPTTNGAFATGSGVKMARGMCEYNCLLLY